VAHFYHRGEEPSFFGIFPIYLTALNSVMLNELQDHASELNWIPEIVEDEETEESDV